MRQSELHRIQLQTTDIESRPRMLRCVARGASNKQIASILPIAEPTVKAHLVHIFS